MFCFLLHQCQNEPVAIILGSYTVGKTAFISKLINIYDARKHKQSVKPIDYKLAYFRGEQRISFRIRDTFGMERFGSFLPYYCRDVSPGIIMFDINSVATFNAIDDYINLLFDCCGDIKIILIGNKFDLPRHVSDAELIAKALQYNAEYVEVPRTGGANIRTAMETIANEIGNVEKPVLPYVDYIEVINTHEKKKSSC